MHTPKEQLKSKIKADIAVIMNGGTPVAGIHFFCSENLAVAHRHEVQEWARNEHRVHLDIYDGQAIAELLAEPDVFWIAMRYLSIPSEIYPRNEERGRYAELLSKWKDSNLTPENFADFFELKSGIRHATFVENAKLDLPFWIEKLSDLKNVTTWLPLQRRPSYEIAVASLRGLGTFDGYEDHLRSYFGQVAELAEVADIEDATVLWMYCAEAHRRGLLHVAREELNSWRDAVVTKVEGELRESESPGRRCSLLELRGRLHLIMPEESGGMPNVAAALSSWLELSNLASDAPLFPLERFADNLTQIITMLNHPDLDSLAKRVDELLAERHGQFVAAEKCRDRAVALYRGGEIIRAIKQIHQAKIKWFAEEALHGSVLAMLFLTRSYRELGLAFAGKYYALAAAYASIKTQRDDLKKFVPSALFEAASCDYLQGAWLSFLDLEYIALATFSAFSREADSDDPDSELNVALYHASLIHRLTQRLDPALLPLIEERVNKWGLTEDFQDFQRSVIDPTENKELAEVWQSLEEQMLGRPFSDLGARRELIFEALGVTWKFRWNNNYQMTAVTEQFVAVLQILLADLAGIDLCLLRTTVDVDVWPASGSEISIRPVASNVSTRWNLGLPIQPQGGTTQELASDVTAIASTLLYSASLLPHERLLEILENSFREGLSTKVFSVNRYEALYREFTNQDAFDSFGRQSKSPPELGRTFIPTLHHQLEWVAGPGPGYSKERAEEGLRNRYESLFPPIQRTLGTLVETEQFRETVRTLRGGGWRDWHILMAAVHVALNYRLRRAQELGLSQREVIELAREWRHQPERENSIPVPLEEFSSENLQMQLRLSMVATVKSYGLQLPGQTPDLDAVSDLLGERYRYWEDDIEHPDYGLSSG
jgi:hypothetical protein